MGACENASRMTEHWIGMTMSDTANPTTKVDAVKTLDEAVGLDTSAPGTLKMGIHPNQVESHRATPTTWPCRKNSPHRRVDDAGHGRHQVDE